MKNTTIFFLLFFSILFSGYTQEEITSPTKKTKKDRSAYIGVAVGLGISNLTDFATSPLRYSGIQNYFSAYFLRKSLYREMEVGGSYSGTQYSTTYNNNLAISTSKSVSLYYSQLYRLNPLSSDKLNVKVGGLFNTTTNFRVNPSFMNNSLGLDIIPTIFGSIKTEKVFKNNAKPIRRIWFIKYTKSNLSLRLNVGILNSSIRNGYIYSNHSSVVNNPNLFDDYEFNAFSGFRMSSALDYTLDLENKNQIQFSYLWDAYQTNTYDNLAIASHVLKISILFNTNNK